jgi:hypothetical protein
VGIVLQGIVSRLQDSRDPSAARCGADNLSARLERALHRVELPPNFRSSAARTYASANWELFLIIPAECGDTRPMSRLSPQLRRAHQSQEDDDVIEAEAMNYARVYTGRKGATLGRKHWIKAKNRVKPAISRVMDSFG